MNSAYACPPTLPRTVGTCCAAAMGHEHLVGTLPPYLSYSLFICPLVRSPAPLPLPCRTGHALLVFILLMEQTLPFPLEHCTLHLFCACTCLHCLERQAGVGVGAGNRFQVWRGGLGGPVGGCLFLHCCYCTAQTDTCYYWNTFWKHYLHFPGLPCTAGTGLQTGLRTLAWPWPGHPRTGTLALWTPQPCPHLPDAPLPYAPNAPTPCALPPSASPCLACLALCPASLYCFPPAALLQDILG